MSSLTIGGKWVDAYEQPGTFPFPGDQASLTTISVFRDSFMPVSEVVEQNSDGKKNG